MGVEVVDDFFCNIADASHSDDYSICIFCAIVVEELVVCSKLFVDHSHVLLDNCRKFIIELVASFSVLEENVSVFMRTSHVRMLRIESVVSECLYSIHIAHFLKIIIIPYSNLLDFMGCSETIEEVDEWNLSADCGKVGHRRKIHDFLYVAFTKHCETCLAASHNVAVVSEDVQ